MPLPSPQKTQDTLLNETILAHLRQLLAHTEQQQEHLRPQLTDLCRALRTGLSNSPHRELLWKGVWTSNLITPFADTARATTRNMQLAVIIIGLAHAAGNFPLNKATSYIRTANPSRM